MNIKEIALKVAEKHRATQGHIQMTATQLIEEFEALVAELAKGNEPFCFVYPEIANAFIKVSWVTAYRKRSSPEQTALYPLPPTAKQIEQETAEAIAKHFEQSGISGEYLAEVIRSGAWKEYK